MLPRSRVALLPRSGHFPRLDEPERFSAALIDFLAEDVVPARKTTKRPAAVRPVVS